MRLDVVLRQELRRLEAERGRVESQIRTIRFILMEPMVRSWPEDGTSSAGRSIRPPEIGRDTAQVAARQVGGKRKRLAER